MKKAPTLLVALVLLIAPGSNAAEEVILRLRPEANAPVLIRITASKKVLLDAPPADENPEWRQLELKVPFDGYVNAASLSKNFAIADNTPVHVLPDASSELITHAKEGDLYEVKRVTDQWAALRFQKELRTFFPADALSATGATTAPKTEPAPLPPPPMLDLAISAPSHTPEPNARIYAPGLAVGQTSPEDLPPENVIWKSARTRSAAATETQARNLEHTGTPKRVDSSTPSLPDFEKDSIIVSPDQTQAREMDPGDAPPADKTTRLLVGRLIRKIESVAPDYPIRLHSDEGRLIAYVDFSGYFIEDLSPYLNQRVYLRGRLAPKRANSRELVLFVDDIQIAP